MVLSSAVLAASCGGDAGDILALEVGPPEGEPLRLTVTEDGRGTCDGGELEAISSERLIEAREVRRELEPLAARGESFGGTNGSAADAAYAARIQEGTVRWVEEGPSDELPEVLPRAAALAQDLRADLC